MSREHPLLLVTSKIECLTICVCQDGCVYRNNEFVFNINEEKNTNSYSGLLSYHRKLPKCYKDEDYGASLILYHFKNAAVLINLIYRTYADIDTIDFKLSKNVQSQKEAGLYFWGTFERGEYTILKVCVATRYYFQPTNRISLISSLHALFKTYILVITKIYCLNNIESDSHYEKFRPHTLVYCRGRSNFEEFKSRYGTQLNVEKTYFAVFDFNVNLLQDIRLKCSGFLSLSLSYLRIVCNLVLDTPTPHSADLVESQIKMLAIADDNLIERIFSTAEVTPLKRVATAELRTAVAFKLRRVTKNLRIGYDQFLTVDTDEFDSRLWPGERLFVSEGKYFSHFEEMISKAKHVSLINPSIRDEVCVEKDSKSFSSILVFFGKADGQFSGVRSYLMFRRLLTPLKVKLIFKPHPRDYCSRVLGAMTSNISSLTTLELTKKYPNALFVTQISAVIPTIVRSNCGLFIISNKHDLGEYQSYNGFKGSIAIDELQEKLTSVIKSSFGEPML